MHPLNTPEIIGAEIFSKTADTDNLRLEYLYNKLYRTLPFPLSFDEKFSQDSLTTITKHFDQLFCSLRKTTEGVFEDGIWVGKSDSIFADTLVQVDFRDKFLNVRMGRAVFYKDDIKAENIQVKIMACCASKEQAYKLIELLEVYKPASESKIYMLTQNYGELSFTGMPVPSLEMNLHLNYGAEFPAFHESLISSLTSKKSGLYLFHGDPGTGKSSYIKHLLSENIDRKIVYIPVGLINSLVSPDMLPLLMENKDVVLVIEDAEKALLSRDFSGSSEIVSTILNLTDGFIGDALNISIIATFNTEKDNIDQALLRKGRLRLSYEFKKLSKEDGQTLANSLGKSTDLITGDMSLAEIYNLEDVTGFKEPEQRRVGFC